jgi:hypothetical protein
MRQSHTSIIERNITWEDAFETEPYEVAWASEAIFFVRTLSVLGVVGDVDARVQISPDGMRWCDEGTVVPLSGEVDGVTFGGRTAQGHGIDGDCGSFFEGIKNGKRQTANGKGVASNGDGWADVFADGGGFTSW